VTAPARVARRLVLPIRLGIDPMERLLVASLKGDPEFEAIEPQVFDDKRNGHGMRVLRYRHDGRVDIYFQRGVHVDLDRYTFGTGIGDFAETTIDPCRFGITGRGVQLEIGFVDAQGRRVELSIHEDADSKQGFAMLAPVGADVVGPKQLFLVHMPSIDLVRRRGSTFEGRIGERALGPAALPVPLRGHAVWFTRYVERPAVATLNPPADTPLEAEFAGAGTIEIEGSRFALDANGDVMRIAAALDTRRAELEFARPFPNLDGLGAQDTRRGEWAISINDAPITGGMYRVERRDQRVEVDLDVTRPWVPAKMPWAMAIFLRLVPSFRNWPATYRWHGVIEYGAATSLQGGWLHK
jgi:hypothetical protein